MPNFVGFWTAMAQFLMQNIQGLGAVAAIAFGGWIMVTPNKHHAVPKAIGIIAGLLVAIWGPVFIAWIRSMGGGQIVVQ